MVLRLFGGLPNKTCFYSAHFPIVVQRLTWVQRGSVGFSVAQWLQRGSVGSALACCKVKADPSSNPGSTSHGCYAHWADSCEDMEMGPANVYEWMNYVWMYPLYKNKINANKVANSHSNLYLYVVGRIFTCSRPKSLWKRCQHSTRAWG
jgi:hypothetical protein